jgi:hypothetical protein
MDLNFQNKRRFSFEMDGVKVKCIRRAVYRYPQTEISAGSAESENDHWVYLYLSSNGMSPKIHLFHIDEALIMQAVMGQAIMRDMLVCVPQTDNLPIQLEADSVFNKNRE